MAEKLDPKGKGSVIAGIFRNQIFIPFAALILLALFNLIPIPPLDGSRIAFMFLPAKWYFGLMKYERIIMIVFFAIVLFMTRVLNFSILSYVSLYILGGMQYLLSFIPLFKDGISWLIAFLI